MSIDDEWNNFLLDTDSKNDFIDIEENSNNISKEDIPKCSEIYISTKTKIVFLNKDIDIYKVFWNIPILNYNDYVNSFITQEDEINTTTLSQSHTDSVTTITVASTSGFDSSGTLFIGNEQVTYTTVGSSTTFTGVTRGANSTTAAAHDSGEPSLWLL